MATNISKNGIIKGVLDFFCLVCETNILSTAECEAHMYTAEHEKKLSSTAYYKEFKEDYIRKIKNNYFCELCNKFLPLLPRVRLHVKDQKHIDNKNIHGWLKRVDGAIVAFNKLVIDDTAWHGFSDESCIICNTECDDNDIHKKLPSHILNLLQMEVDFDQDKNIYRKIDEFSFQCLTCNLMQNVKDITNHFDSPTHQNLLEISYKTYELSKVCTKINCKPNDDVNKSVDQTDVYYNNKVHVVHSNNQVHVDNTTEKAHITFGNIREEELFKNSKAKACTKSNWEVKDSVNKSNEETDVCLPIKNQVDIENTAKPEHNNPETIVLEPNEGNIETNSNDCSKSNCEHNNGVNKSDKQSDVCLLSNNQVGVGSPAEIEQNITETIELESNEENIKTNKKDGSKSNCEPKDGIIKSVQLTDVCLPSNNHVELEYLAETTYKQNTTETCKIELNEEKIKTNSTDSSKSNCKSKDGVKNSDEQTDICLHLSNQVDKENTPETEQNIPESIELEANAENIESNSKDCSKSNCDPKDGVNKSDKQTDVTVKFLRLPSNNQVGAKISAETEQNIPETIKLESNENSGTNSKYGWNHEAEEIRKKYEEELFKILEANACTKSIWEAKESVNKCEEQTDVGLSSKNQEDIESPAEIEQNILKTIEFGPNEDNFETISTDSLKSNYKPKDGNIKSIELSNVCLPSNDQLDIENPAETKQNNAETIELDPNEDNTETDSSKSNCEPKDDLNKSSEQIDLCLHLNNQVDIESPAETEEIIPEIFELELNDENIETNSKDDSKNATEETIKKKPVQIETFSSSVLPKGNEIENSSKLNGNESFKIKTIEEVLNTQICENNFSIQEFNKLNYKIEKIPTHSFVDYMIYTTNSMHGVNFCDIIINNNIIIPYTSFSFITVNRDYYNCQACDEIFTIITVQEHFSSLKHDMALIEAPVLIQYVSEFIREIRPGYFHCGYCNAIDSMDDIETHLNSVNHKECKGIASWRLHLYQQLMAKSEFRTIYAEKGFSSAISIRIKDQHAD